MNSNIRLSGKFTILEMNTNFVTLRYFIDQTWPEYVDMKITRDRWEKLNRPVELDLQIDDPRLYPREA
jgi:hypothetical protein